jgi:hypothetical protein
MFENNVWTPQDLANELGKSRQFVIDVITGKTKKYQLSARKMGRSWVISETEAKSFIDRYHNPPKDVFTTNDIAKAIGKSRKYVLDSLTGYGGRKEPRLAGTKRGDRWVIEREEAERFIGLHVMKVSDKKD